MSDNTLGIIGDDNVLSADELSFTQLNQDIGDAENELVLSNNYTYTDDDNAFINGISIEKQITIRGESGKNITIDGADAAKIFNIASSGVTLQNINFVNSKGAILVNETATSCTIENCNFQHNYNNGRGGAIHLAGNDGKIILSNFTDNSANWVDYHAADSDRGGSIYVSGNNSNITNCNFLNNKAGFGAAISYGFHNPDNPSENVIPNKGFLYNCNFTDNTVDLNDDTNNNGGAIDSNCYNLTVLKCNFTNNTANFAGAIRLNSNASDSKISYCIFNDNKGTLDYSDSKFASPGTLEIIASNVQVNYCNFTNNTGTHAGAIKVGDWADYVIVSDCNFANNSACYDDENLPFIGYAYGGAIEWQGWYGKLINCNFTDNYVWTVDDSPADAGAIQWSGFEGNITNCNFTNNYAENSTGAVRFTEYASDGIISNCNFTDNHADGYAGAIAWLGESGKVMESYFFNNTADGFAGAIYFGNSTGNIDNCIFNNNSATEDDSYAGAIWVFGDDVGISNCNFTDNFANKYAGAILVNGEHVTVSYCNFTNNSATADNAYAGAIYAESGNIGVNNCNFTNNSAESHSGAIYFNINNGIIDNCNFTGNRAGVYAGAIGSYGENTHVAGCDFTGNHAGNRAGAVWFYDSAVIDDCNFTNNSAFNGGAMYWGWDTRINNCNFANNSAKFGEYDIDNQIPMGGAIYKMDDGELNIANSNFTNNSAFFGGAIYLHENTRAVVKDCIFYINNATYVGGAIYGYRVIELTINDSNFTENTASTAGAVCADIKEDFNMTGCNFTRNKAVEVYSGDGPMGYFSAGAVLLSATYIVDGENIYPTISNCRFEDNLAPYLAGGIAICDGGNHATIEDSYFNGNNASWASAIWLQKNAYLDIINTEFGKNQANSSELNISVIEPVSYYPSNVIVNITLVGNDNIINAILNGGDLPDSPYFMNEKLAAGNVSHIQLQNVTYERYRNGAFENVTTPNRLIHPKNATGQ
ncbi:MAG: right-handed parallel beta-helix repeat-containing protein, partial [Methanobrevibacter sp.]|nr:right-handed parallel beta-helix repeat-containing protein [Methanobrevibacter sp.]